MRRSVVKLGYTVGLLLFVIYAFVTLRGPQGVPALIQKRREIRELEKRNASLAREIELKRDRIHRLKENQAEQELVIRERLKLVRPGEKVFILEDQGKKPQ